MRQPATAFPVPSTCLESFGLKFSPGGAHISRTMMLAELGDVLANVPASAKTAEYTDAIVQRNVLGKSTDSTRRKSYRHLRELYALDPNIPIFGLLRQLYSMDPASLPLLALQVAWSRDPLLRATTPHVVDASEGQKVETAALVQTLAKVYADQYSVLNLNKIARNAASSWTQSGHLAGRGNKTRRRINPTVHAVAMAFVIGYVAGYQGTAIFSNPWCRLLDMDSFRARELGLAAHRAGLLNLRTLGEVVELTFPLFIKFVER